jgi:tetratricopeptide (TPR) repeat protein
VRAAILEVSDLRAAVSEYYEAVKIRPDDFALWLGLARARELAGDNEGAVAAAKQAILLAPFYAQPHYQVGNILLRAGRRDEGFRELRFAGASNPTLMPGVIDLAWRLSSGNVQFVQQAIEPNTPEAYRMLGQYFRQRKEIDSAIAMFTAAGAASEVDRQSYVAELLAANRFGEAARLWSVGHSNGVAPGVMIDPGFEQESDLNEPGFGWRLGESREGFQLSLDTANPKEGRTSLKIEFKGASNPASPIVSQLVLVDRRARYQLRFAIRAEDIVSGGLPQVVVIDANA